MNNQIIIRCLRIFFKKDYYRLYLRSGAWSDSGLGDNGCLKWYRAIKQAVSGCTPEHQLIMEQRYQLQKKSYEVMEQLCISKTTYFIKDKQALLQFAECLKQVEPQLLSEILSEYS